MAHTRYDLIFLFSIHKQTTTRYINNDRKKNNEYGMYVYCFLLKIGRNTNKYDEIWISNSFIGLQVVCPSQLDGLIWFNTTLVINYLFLIWDESVYPIPFRLHTPPYIPFIAIHKHWIELFKTTKPIDQIENISNWIDDFY